MNIIAAVLIMFAIAGAGGSIRYGLSDLGDSIKVANGYKEVCTGKWYERSCEWVKP